MTGPPDQRAPTLGAFVFNTTLTNEDAKSYVATMAQLDAVLSASAELVSHAFDSPAADSPMGLAYQKMLRDPFEQAGLLWLSSEDHFRTVLMILQNNLLPIFSLYSLLRPAAEADVRMAYLLDVGIDERERLARGLSVRYVSLREQSKVRLQSVPNAAHFAERAAVIEKKAKDNGIAPVFSKPSKGRPEVIGFGEGPRKEVDLFEKYHEGRRLLYQVLSSHIHARPWSWLDARKSRPTSEAGVSLQLADLDIPLYVNFLMLSVKTHENVLIRVLELSGHTRAEWESAKERALQRVRARYLALLKSAPQPPP